MSLRIDFIKVEILKKDLSTIQEPEKIGLLVEDNRGGQIYWFSSKKKAKDLIRSIADNHSYIESLYIESLLGFIKNKMEGDGYDAVQNAMDQAEYGATEIWVEGKRYFITQEMIKSWDK